MKSAFFIALLSTHSLLQASDFGTLFMGTTIFSLLFILIIMLTRHLKNLQRENLRYRTFFLLAQTPAFLIDEKGRVRDLNENAIKLSGHTKEQLAAQKWDEMLLSETSVRQVKQRIGNADTNGNIEFTASLRCSDGTLIERGFTLSKLPDPLRGSILSLSARRKETAHFPAK